MQNTINATGNHQMKRDEKSFVALSAIEAASNFSIGEIPSDTGMLNLVALAQTA